MNFPIEIPKARPNQVWTLQIDLLAHAEKLLGARDICKIIYQPTFHDGGPQIRNTPNFDGAFAELSSNAASCWAAVVYELGHETVHLLNPTIGCTNWLEEGIAVAFSTHVLNHYGFFVQSPALGPYTEALELVQELPGGAFSVARDARIAAGALSAVSFEILKSVAPNHPLEKLQRLSSKCVPR